MDPEPTQGAKAVAPEPDEQRPTSSSGADDATSPPATTPGKRRRGKTPAPRENEGTVPNNVRRLRQAAMMSKAELARRAGVSPLTIDRVESGCPCRKVTKRKTLEALGLQPSAAKEVFPDEDLG
jgi:ribosome-binding protein aMBF1 (putative translation factor)